MTNKWRRDTFLIARSDRPLRVVGYVYNGLGLDHRTGGWVLTHLGMGLRVATFRCAKFAAETIATEVAECGDWDWESPDGDRNKDPGILSRAASILWEHRDIASVSWRPEGEQTWRKDIAASVRRVIEERAT